MIFETKEDINAPIGRVFPCISDFAGFERSALRRGVKITRLDSLQAPGPGMIWDLVFRLRGKRREVQLELVQMEAPHLMRFHTKSGGVAGVMTVELIALSKQSTRLVLHLEMKAANLTGRLLLQSLKLAKSSLVSRVNAKLYEFARGTEQRLGLA